MDGILILKGTKCYLVWQDNPHCPKPFPLIIKHRLTDQIIPIHKDDQNNYTLYSNSITDKQFYWGGIGSITINKKSKTSFQPNETISIILGIKEPIMEEQVVESKFISIQDDTSKPQDDYTDTLQWDAKLGVLRDTKDTIISVPKYETWNQLITYKTNRSFNATLRWNNLLKKYQVITISIIKDGI